MWSISPELGEKVRYLFLFAQRLSSPCSATSPFPYVWLFSAFANRLFPFSTHFISHPPPVERSSFLAGFHYFPTLSFPKNLHLHLSNFSPALHPFSYSTRFLKHKTLEQKCIHDNKSHFQDVNRKHFIDYLIIKKRENISLVRSSKRYLTSVSLFT